MPAFRRIVKPIRRLYRRLFEQSHNVELRHIQAVLRQVSMFRELPRATLRDVAESMHHRTYQRDEYLYYEGDPGLGLYIVRRGRVRLLAEDESGTVHELRQASEHEIIGELCVLGGYRRIQTAQAATEVQVLGFFRPDLKTLMKRSPRAGTAVLGALARHLAAREVELIRLLEENDGKVAALRLLESASLRTDGLSLDASTPRDSLR